MVDTINKIGRLVPNWVFYLAGLGLAGLWFYYALDNQLGAEPAKVLEHKYGLWALQLFIAGLLITPLRDLFRINLIKWRRAFGVLTFFFVLAHFLIYLLLDQQLWWDAIIKDITKRPYIIFGVVSMIVLIPLAMTSNNLAIRKIGPVVWRKLHLLTYLAAALGGLHFVMLRKTWQLEPLIYAAIIGTLLGYRAYNAIQKRRA